MGITLPGGFSPTQALKQAGDYAGVYGDNSQGADYDVFSERSFDGGARDPVEGTGGFWGGAQGAVNTGWSPSASGGYVQGPSTTTPTQPTNNNNNNAGYNATQAAQKAAAQAAQKAAAQKAQEDAALRQGYQTSQGNYQQGARTSLTDIGNEYDVNARNFLNSMSDQQGEINQGNAQNQLNLRQSMQNIIKGIQTGVRSGGVALAGMNASDSGASEALARAYAQSGNRQTGEARGSAADQFAELQRSQGVLNRTKDEGFADQDVWKTTETNRVKTQLSGELQALAAEAQGKGINGVIDTGSVNGIVQNALDRLQQIDQANAGKRAGIKADTADQSIDKAVQMEQAGAVGNAFNVTGPNVSYGGQGGAGLKGAGASQMPLYVKNKDSLSVVPGTGNKDKEKQLA